MDYLTIVLDGYADSNAREFLTEYFFREYKKALQAQYSPEEFKSGCMGVINMLKLVARNEYNSRKQELYVIESLEQAKGKINPSVSEEIQSLTVEDFYIPLGVITNAKYQGFMTLHEVEFIESRLTDAHNNILAMLKSDGGEVKKKYAERWYAIYHAIALSLRIEKPFPDSSKDGIIAEGKRLYGTGQGFYIEFIHIDVNNMVSYVRSMPEKDRKKWKQIIQDISNNNADVISWLKKQPN